ncbi:contractile injection system tape measure protein [uncultured Roseobacter sp.]|uniref:contractile injection system tape measure protein n=1 Tax=uncultured Roseobacter sp. TaxID=114847 RepID=UPI002629BDA0|nr:contractile injection system tape measure protein [uncultured Roseobacter sp.]
MSARPARYDAEARHRIGRFEADFAVSAESGPLSTPERLAHQVRAEILPALEDVFADDSVAGCDAWIETLEIDLGAWPAAPDWPSLRETLRVQLLAALAPYLQKKKDGGTPADRLAVVETQGPVRPSVDDPAAASSDVASSRSGAIIPLAPGREAPSVPAVSDKITALVARPDQDVFAVLRAAFRRSPQGFEKALARLPDGFHRQALQRVLLEGGEGPGRDIGTVESALTEIFTRAGHALKIARRNATTLTARLLMHPKAAGLLRADADIGADPHANAGPPEHGVLERSKARSFARFRTVRETDVPGPGRTAEARSARSPWVPGDMSDADRLRADWKAKRASVAAFLVAQTAEDLMRILEQLVPAGNSGFHQAIQGFLATTAHRQRALVAIVSAILDETAVDIEALRRAEKTAATSGVSPEANDAGAVERDGDQTEWTRVLSVLAGARSDGERVTPPKGALHPAQIRDTDGDAPGLFRHTVSPSSADVESQRSASNAKDVVSTAAHLSASDAALGGTDEFPPHAGVSETKGVGDQDRGTPARRAGSDADISCTPSSEAAAEGSDGLSSGEGGAGSDPAQLEPGDALERDPPQCEVGSMGSSGDVEAPPGLEPEVSESHTAKIRGPRHGVSERAPKWSEDHLEDTPDDDARKVNRPLEGRDTSGGRTDASPSRGGTTGQTGQGTSPAVSETSKAGQQTQPYPTGPQTPDAQDGVDIGATAGSEESARGSDTGRVTGDPEGHGEGAPPTPSDRSETRYPATDHLRTGATDTASAIVLVEAAFGDAAPDIIAIADMVWDAVPGSVKAKAGARPGSGAFERAEDADGDPVAELSADVLLDLIARAGPTAPSENVILRYLVDFASPEIEDQQTLLRHVIARLSYPVSGHSPALRREVLRGLKELFDEISHPAPESSGGSDMAEPQTPDAGPTPRILSHQAGLVLFHPYYKLLFSRLQLLTEKNDLQPDQLGRARSVLAALAGEAEAVAPLDPLARVLLGLPEGATPPPPVPLTEEEAQLIEGLIRSVIAQWSALGQTSPAGLQEAFIRRGGQLWVDATGAHLRVDPGPFDVLLDSLPWLLDTVVALPWMPVPCHVIWRTQDG